MNSPRHPALYQINTRVWLTALSRRLGRPAMLEDVPDAELDRLAEMGFDWVWLLSVWQTGPEAQRVSRTNPGWVEEFRHTLPDLTEADIPGSGFAITGYHAHPAVGGKEALAGIRDRLRRRGIKLMLDFVPNHLGLGHPWALSHPERFVAGTEIDLARAPQNYTRVGDRIFAYGRDPYFSGWPDTLQLDYGSPETQEVMAAELARIATQCDGVRCDMAMLVLPAVFERTWGVKVDPFWPAAIRRVREQVPGFVFMAEVYWDLEWELQQQGFDYTYDKRLYDRLHQGHARPVREHLTAGLNYQARMARFLENHDEPRAATAFPPARHEAAAVVTFLSPGLRFFHQGQFEGRTKRISPHLGRGPDEPSNPDLGRFYDHLLGVLRLESLRNGEWRLLECAPAWEGNWTWDCFLAFSWNLAGGGRVVVAVNYAGNQSQCYVRLPYADLGGARWRLTDRLGGVALDRDGDDLRQRGLFLDVPPWSASVFTLEQLT